MKRDFLSSYKQNEVKRYKTEVGDSLTFHFLAPSSSEIRNYNEKLWKIGLGKFFFDRDQEYMKCCMRRK